MSTAKHKADCFLSFADVAELLTLDEKTIRNGECGTDQLLRIRLGARTVFSFNDVQTWMAEQVIAARNRQTEKRDTHNKAAAKIRLLQKPVLDRVDINQFFNKRP